MRLGSVVVCECELRRRFRESEGVREEENKTYVDKAGNVALNGGAT